MVIANSCSDSLHRKGGEGATQRRRWGLVHFRDGLVDESDGVIGEVVGDVHIIGGIDLFGVEEDLALFLDYGLLEIESAAAGRAPEAVETAVERVLPFVVADMPLPDYEGSEAGGLERFGEGDAAFVEPAAVAGLALVLQIWPTPAWWG